MTIDYGFIVKQDIKPADRQKMVSALEALIFRVWIKTCLRLAIFFQEIIADQPYRIKHASF